MRLAFRGWEDPREQQEGKSWGDVALEEVTSVGCWQSLSGCWESRSILAFLLRGRRGQAHSSEEAHHYAWLLASSAGVTQNPMFWCPAPLPGGKAELAVKPPRAVKDEEKAVFSPGPTGSAG